MSDIERFALQYCGRIVEEDTIEDGVEGYYTADDDTIHVSARLNDVQRTCVLAHESSHAYHRDTYSTKWKEERANEEAARLLINVDEYAALERVNDNVWWLARELGVMPWVVVAFRRYLSSVGLLHMEQDWVE